MQADEVPGGLYHVGGPGIATQMLPGQPVRDGGRDLQAWHRHHPTACRCRTASVRMVTHSFMRLRLVGPQSTSDRPEVAAGPVR
jgi:hypothetical protein